MRQWLQSDSFEFPIETVLKIRKVTLMDSLILERVLDSSILYLKCNGDKSTCPVRNLADREGTDVVVDDGIKAGGTLFRVSTNGEGGTEYQKWRARSTTNGGHGVHYSRATPGPSANFSKLNSLAFQLEAT